MGKIDKKKTVHPLRKAKNLNQSLINKFKIKECTVKLNRLHNINMNIVVKNGKIMLNNVQVEEISHRVFRADVRIANGGANVVKSTNTNDTTRTKADDSKTLNQRINAAWALEKKQKKDNSIVLTQNQLVLAKMKSYSPWPAKILSFTKSRKSSHVYFYGTHNTGRVNEAELVNFEDAHDVIRLLLLRPNLNGFLKGILEVEYEMGVPKELSITNQEKCIKN